LRPGKYIVYDAPLQNQGQGLRFGVASFDVEREAGHVDDALAVPAPCDLVIADNPAEAAGRDQHQSKRRR
jgi:hypothetical protein